MFSRLALLSLFAATVSSTVSDCGAGKSLFTINSQGFGPDPPIKGEKATLWIDYTVPSGAEVSKGTAKYSISLNGIPFSPSTEDLCTQISCPQVPGTYNISSGDVWEGGISGKIVSKIEWFDTSNTLLLCSQTTIKVSNEEFEDSFALDSSSSSSGSSNSSSSSSSGSSSSSSSSSGSSSSSSGSSSSSSGSSSSSSGSSSTSSGSSSTSSGSSSSSSGSSSSSSSSSGSSSSSSSSSGSSSSSSSSSGSSSTSSTSSGSSSSSSGSSSSSSGSSSSSSGSSSSSSEEEEPVRCYLRKQAPLLLAA